MTNNSAEEIQDDEQNQKEQTSKKLKKDMVFDEIEKNANDIKTQKDNGIILNKLSSNLVRIFFDKWWAITIWILLYIGIYILPDIFMLPVLQEYKDYKDAAINLREAIFRLGVFLFLIAGGKFLKDILALYAKNRKLLDDKD